MSEVLDDMIGLTKGPRPQDGKIILTCPRFVTIPRKTIKDKKVQLNMNAYRNLHYMDDNNAKKLFKSLMKDQILAMPNITDPVNIQFQVFKKNKSRLDKMNVISVVSKYLMDAIVELGKMPDDNDDWIRHELLLPTQIDKYNPRVEVTITPIVLEC